MTPRWLLCLVVGLAAPIVHAQTTPVASPDAEFAAQADSDDGEYEDTQPMAPSAPPALPQETPSARPYAEAVWTAGHWYWDDTEWRYKPGAWIAKMPGYQFVNGYWSPEGSSWRWIPGGWAKPGSTVVEIPTEVTNEELSIAQEPPALREEVRSVAPAADYEWAPGYWYWSGSDWDWIVGSWVLPPQPGLAFVSPHWSRRGSSYVFIGGGWAVRGSRHVVVPYYRHAGVSVRWGHPNYFLHRWNRYPTVRHHYFQPRPYRGPSYHQSWSPPRGGSYRSAPNRGGGHDRGTWSPGRSGPNRGGGNDRGGNDRGGHDRGGHDRGGNDRGGGGGHSRGGGGGGGGRSHDASPVR